MTDLNEVRKYLMRSAKEAATRASKMRAESSNMTIEADRYERESAALETAARALDQSTNAISISGDMLSGGELLGGIGRVATGAFVPVPRTEKPAPWDRDQPDQEGPSR